MKSTLSLVALGLLAAAPAAQDSLTFPLHADGVDAATGVTKLATNAVGVDALLGKNEVILTDVPMPSGPVSVQLTRIRHETMGFGYQVNGVPAPNLLDGTSLTVWQGSILGNPSSEVLLSFSHFGSRGWVNDGAELVHLMPQTDASGNWFDGPVFLTTEAELASMGSQFSLDCATEDLADLRSYEIDSVPVGPGETLPLKGGSTVLYGCDIALETDYQLNQVFGGDLAAETTYITTLWSAISARYVEQVNTVLTFPYVQFYTTPGDPWSTPGSGGSIDMLNEFVAAWSGNIPAGADIGHFVSGADLGGGVAYLEVLCNDAHDFSFAVSGNIDGSVPFPIVVSPLNWDFMVCAHETGHNFASPHTHDYSPPIDQCASGSCITDGTIMSYCHLCSGGLANITTYFHPLVVNVINGHVQSCLDIVSGISALPPTLILPGTPTTLVASVAGTPAGNVEMNYRFDSGSSFSTVVMSSIGGGDYSADMPAAACGDTPEVYFSYDDVTAGMQSTDTFSMEVGVQLTLFHDDMESDMGWTVGAPGDDATTGIWERGDPLGTSAQPSTGVAIGGGTDCYFTGQGSSGGSIGENDVDGGTTTLISPSIDLSAGDAVISYWRWYSNTQGSSPSADTFVVQVSNGGAWQTVETVGPTGFEANGGWWYHEFVVSDFVTPTANVQVRFQASDLGDGSIVEAGVDEFTVFEVSCDTCQTDLGFGGPGSATLEICGPALTTGATATLTIQGGPGGQPAWVGFSSTNNPTSLLGGTIVPWPVVGVVGLTLDGSGTATAPVAGGSPVPASLFLQGIILDGGTNWLITNAVEAEFLP